MSDLYQDNDTESPTPGTQAGTQAVACTGRPLRTEPILPDDVVNLVIALHTARSLDEFLERT